ncbi:MAG: multifunctional CCA tRNA nucleotidyl transferase/2'3'-cyclic phosphodiesterase/2'nucleotidase/phosphatase [Cellvibrionaceae bacterium]
MKIFLVGGAVRDQLLHFPFKERDWVVVGSTPEEMIKEGFKAVGKDFPVFLHPKTGEEYALARTERKTAPGYKGFTFHTDKSVTLEEDLERRDLTINAIAQDSDGNIIDPYKGQDDLKHKKLQHVSDAFAEDPVRILRVARFKSRYHHLGFTIAENTLLLMKTIVAAGETKHLVAERVWQECHKALGEQNPDQFFITLDQCHALKDILSELNHNERLALSIKYLTKTCEHASTTTQRFAALCYPLAEDEIKNLCKRLGVPNHFRDLARLIQQEKNNVEAYSLASQSLHENNTSLIAERIANTLHSLDANRKPQRFYESLELIAWLSQTEKADNIISFWKTALKYYEQVEPKMLIEQGYKKSALGEAIKQERIKQLEFFLNNGK